MNEVIVRVNSLADFQPLHAAEAKVLAGLGSGDFSRIGDGLRPEGMTSRELSARSFCVSSFLAATIFACTRRD